MPALRRNISNIFIISSVVEPLATKIFTLINPSFLINSRLRDLYFLKISKLSNGGIRLFIVDNIIFHNFYITFSMLF